MLVPSSTLDADVEMMDIAEVTHLAKNFATSVNADPGDKRNPSTIILSKVPEQADTPPRRTSTSTPAAVPMTIQMDRRVASGVLQDPRFGIGAASSN